MTKKPNGPRYDCSRCPGYCCTYPRIELLDEDARVGSVLDRGLATIAHGDGVCTTFIPKISHNASASTSGRNPA